MFSVLIPVSHMQVILICILSTVPPIMVCPSGCLYIVFLLVLHSISDQPKPADFFCSFLLVLDGFFEFFPVLLVLRNEGVLRKKVFFAFFRKKMLFFFFHPKLK